MSSRVASKQSSISRTQPGPATDPGLKVQLFTLGQEPEVLAFLHARPLHTVFMRGFIHDNGLESPLNRGGFYGCRDTDGRLQGVALIGHATLFEARCEPVVHAFAREAQEHAEIHMVMGEQQAVEVFLKYFVEIGKKPRRICGELLFEQQLATGKDKSMGRLRRATIKDLAAVMSAQAEMAFAESGVNPMEVDPAGFQQRCRRRIELGRIWVCVENESLMFKADVMSLTPDVIYLEGIYVDARHRGNGFGLSCLAQLSNNLLTRAGSLCLLVNAQSREAQEFYTRAGFTLRSSYSTVFLETNNSS